MIQYLPLILLFIGGSVLTVGDIIMKKWVLSNNIYTFIVGILVYLVGMVFLSFSFKYKNIATASTIFVLFNIITLSIVSWLYFNETLSTFQFVGIMFGICSIICLELA